MPTPTERLALSAALALILGATTLRAQEAALPIGPVALGVLTVVDVGPREHRVGLTEANATALSVLSALSARLGLELEVPDPAITRILDEQRLDFAFSDVDAGDLVDLVASSCSLYGELDDDARKIRISPLPDADDAATAEFLRVEALRKLLVAFGGDADPEREVQLLLRSSALQMSGGHWSAAYDSLSKFVSAYAKRPEAPRACLQAGWCALAAGRNDDAVAMVDKFLGGERDFVRRDPIGETRAQVLLAQAKLASGEISDASLVLTGLVRANSRGDIDGRIGVVSVLLLADVYHRMGEYEKALSLLEGMEWRKRNENEDLRGQIPLYVGICQRRLGDNRRAVQDLRLASYTCPTDALRLRALTEQVRALLDLESPFEALTTSRVALALAPKGLELLEILRLQSLSYRGLNLDRKAVDTLVAAIIDATTLPSTPHTVAALALAMNDLGRILFAVGDLEAARAVFERIRGQAGMAERATLMIATCDFNATRFKSALQELDSLDLAKVDPELRREVRRLRGDCFMRLRLYEEAVSVWRQEEQIR